MVVASHLEAMVCGGGVITVNTSTGEGRSSMTDDEAAPERRRRRWPSSSGIRAVAKLVAAVAALITALATLVIAVHGR
jgi:hypothetical protein